MESEIQQIEPKEFRKAAPTGTGKAFMESIVESNHHLARAIVLFFFIFLFIFILVSSAINFLNYNDNVKVDLTKEGMILQLNNDGKNKKKLTRFLLSPNIPWVDTELDIAAEEKCKIRVSGNVHLAVRELTQAATADTPLRIPWTDPVGNEFINTDTSDVEFKAKQKLLLKPGSTIGNVIGILWDSNRGNFKSIFDNQREQLSNDVVEVGRYTELANNSGKSARLFLSVNDILLDRKRLKLSEQAYTGGDAKWKEAWSNILKQENYKLWFDDNVGSLMVEIEIVNKDVQ